MSRRSRFFDSPPTSEETEKPTPRTIRETVGQIFQPQDQPGALWDTFRTRFGTSRRHSEDSGHLIQTRISAEDLSRINEWRRKQADLPSRAEAIRRLVNKALRDEVS